MSTEQLAIIILLGILAQIGISVAIGFRRRWRTYRDLAHRIATEADTAGKPVTDMTELGAPPSAPWEGFRPFRVQRKIFEDAHKRICSFHLVPADGEPLAPFRPGQYLTLQLSVPEARNWTNNTILRCYSLSERPNSDHYRLTIKRVPAPTPDLPPGRASNYLHDHVQEGDIIHAKAPSGRFHLIEDATPIALIGSGIGITPILSMVSALLHENTDREIWLFYGVRNRAEQIMKEPLEAMAAHHPNLHLHVCYSRPGDEDIEGADYHHRGHVDIGLLRLTLPLRVKEFYLCGPHSMMETLVPALEEWGIPSHDIHYEAFGPASFPGRAQERPQAAAKTATAVPRPVTVTFSKSGKRLAWDSAAASLLEFAENNGIAVDSGCRAGQCGGCRTGLEGGEVEYTQTPDADVNAKSCLLCISKPRSDLVLSA